MNIYVLFYDGCAFFIHISVFQGRLDMLYMFLFYSYQANGMCLLIFINHKILHYSIITGMLRFSDKAANMFCTGKSCS